jgi:hypothetical protein
MGSTERNINQITLSASGNKLQKDGVTLMLQNLLALRCMQVWFDSLIQWFFVDCRQKI